MKSCRFLFQAQSTRTCLFWSTRVNKTLKCDYAHPEQCVIYMADCGELNHGVDYYEQKAVERALKGERLQEDDLKTPKTIDGG